MNIIFLTHRVPYPPNKGDKIRAFHEIKSLSQNHRISLLCLTDNPKELLYEEELKRYCHSIDVVYLPLYRSKIAALRGLFSKTPLSLPYFYSQELQSRVERKIREDTYHLIFVYCSSMAQYVEHAEHAEHIPKVIDFVDVDSEKWFQYAIHANFPYKYVYQIESKRLRQYEKSLAKKFQHGFLVSEKETNDFRNLVYQNAPVTAISNGVDTTMFNPSQEPYNPNVLVFTGAMDYFANVETMLYFTERILPRIRKTIPEVKLYIVGSNPSVEIKSLETQHSNITVTGFVEQIQPYVLKSAAFVAPMRIGRGINNKILEAMAMGVPVVTNSLGLEGILATPGQDILVEDSTDNFAQQVIRVMKDSTLRKKLSENGRKVIEENYSWERNIRQLDNLLLEIVAEHAKMEI